MSADRVTLADVIDSHGKIGYDDAEGCECGTETPIATHMQHAEHLAQAIRDHLTALAGDAGVREAVADRLMVLDGKKPGQEKLTDKGRAKWGGRADAAVAAFLGCVR